MSYRYTRSRKRRIITGVLTLAILVIVIAAVAVGFVFSSYIQSYTVTGTVKAKWIDYSAETSAYVVVLTDGTLLEVERNLWYYKPEFNPDRLYAQIEVGKTYRFTCWGWRVDILYWYPNIIKVEEIK